MTFKDVSNVSGDFIKNHFDSKQIKARFGNSEILYSTGNKEFPYIIIKFSVPRNAEQYEKDLKIKEEARQQFEKKKEERYQKFKESKATF